MRIDRLEKDMSRTACFLNSPLGSLCCTGSTPVKEEGNSGAVICNETKIGKIYSLEEAVS